jgi:hypothetical protein
MSDSIHGSELVGMDLQSVFSLDHKPTIPNTDPINCPPTSTLPKLQPQTLTNNIPRFKYQLKLPNEP